MKSGKKLKRIESALCSINLIEIEEEEKKKIKREREKKNCAPKIINFLIFN
jgi:hypothetical protein